MPEPIAGENLRFQVENLGRIAHADVEIRPLTLFVGENNSGKSYLATAVWAMVTGAGRVVPVPGDRVWDAAFAEATRILNDPIRGAHVEMEELADIFRELEEWTAGLRPEASMTSKAPWGEWAAERQLGELSAAIARSLPGLAEHPTAKMQPLCEPTSIHIDFARLSRGGVALVGGEGTVRSYESIIIDVGPARLAEVALSMARSILTGLPVSRQVRFLPASRTGYVQLAGAVTDHILSPTAAGEASPLSAIPLPTRDFLRFLVRKQLSRVPSGDSDLLTLLHDRIMGGRFVNVPRPDGISELRYAPTGAQVTLPIPLTSSLVSELMPFALALTEPMGMLIYEEPEAHLHPRLQRVLAQILVRLVRRGTKVLITTHSDTFVQQINNILKRGALGDDAPASPDYGPEDMLRVDDVAAYEFQFRPDGLTEVVRAEVHEEGMILPSFNRELISLTEETVELNERLEARPRS